MNITKRKEINVEEKILAISATKDFVLVGGTSKSLKKYDLKSLEFEVLHTHKKSIKSICIKDEWFAAGSYDATASIFKNGALFDLVEGPKVEIKCVSFSDSLKFFAFATRDRNVWICTIDDNELIEVMDILEHHSQDVKGVVWRGKDLYSYSYDNTIKMYEKIEYPVEGWELVQSIEEHISTVLGVNFIENSDITKMVSCSADGVMNIYEYDGLWNVKNTLKVSHCPIYSMCIIDKKYICFVLNNRSIAVIDENFNLLSIIEHAHSSDINCLFYCEKNRMLYSGGDDGILKIFRINEIS